MSLGVRVFQDRPCGGASSDRLRLLLRCPFVQRCVAARRGTRSWGGGWGGGHRQLRGRVGGLSALAFVSASYSFGMTATLPNQEGAHQTRNDSPSSTPWTRCRRR